jgi:hypothetical protein
MHISTQDQVIPIDFEWSALNISAWVSRILVDADARQRIAYNQTEERCASHQWFYRGQMLLAMECGRLGGVR